MVKMMGCHYHDYLVFILLAKPVERFAPTSLLPQGISEKHLDQKSTEGSESLMAVSCKKLKFWLCSHKEIGFDNHLLAL